MGAAKGKGDFAAPLVALACLILYKTALAHEVAETDAIFVQQVNGPSIVPFIYLGAKHMVTGIDHVLYLVGVVFFLYRLRDVIFFVSLFAIGHSITLLGGVLLGTNVNAYIIDAIIGLSVAYKGLENLGFLRKMGLNIDPRAAVFSFGLAHGLGLATKLLMLSPSDNGLAVNLVSFNVGIELGQILVLAAVVAVLNLLRQSQGFQSGAVVANVLLVAAGLILAVYQAAGYLA